MNLVVKVDGQARSISGVTPSTTTTQLVYALAHSINQKGRFLLVAQLGDSVSQFCLRVPTGLD